MQLREMNLSPKLQGIKTLREQFECDFDPSNLGRQKTKAMLARVSKLVKESRQQHGALDSETNPMFLKLKVMESVLMHHLADTTDDSPRIVVESDARETIGKAQTVMAVQDIIDELQGMIVDISDINVKKLPAIVDNAKMQVGTNESNQFNEQATAALRDLADAISQAKSAMQSALGVFTGESSSAFDQEPEADMDFDQDDLDMDIEQEPAIQEPVGRAKR